LSETVPKGEFRFYSNTSNLQICREILDKMELSNLTPVEFLS
jgi:hypothetical protein